MNKTNSIHEQKRRRFTSGGAGVFTCRCCKRQTRETNGDHGQTQNCAYCFDLAGIENSISDAGDEERDEVIANYYTEAVDLLARIQKSGGKMENWEDMFATLNEWKARQ